MRETPKKTPKKVIGSKLEFFGVNKETGEMINISKPSFDCRWYWSFGYLGNKDCHFHLSSYQTKDLSLKLDDGSFKFVTQQRNINMYDALLQDYDLAPHIKENLWEICDLAKTIYTLKEAAAVFGRGGSHYSSCPPAKYITMSSQEAHRINYEILPALMQVFWNMISGQAKGE